MRRLPVLLAATLAAAHGGCGRREPTPPGTRDPPAAAHEGEPEPTPSGRVRLPGDRCPVEQASLGPGLAVERWEVAGQPAGGGEPCVDVVRVDLARHALRVLSAEPHEARTAPQWREASQLAAVTNAGMFHASGAPVGQIVRDGVALATDNPKMSGYLAWDPVASGDPPAVIVGRDCAGFDLAALRRRYRSVVQSYRLLGCDGQALPWQDPKRYSAAAIALDRDGALVLLHARAAFTMAELSAALAGHDLAGALFLEGGPEASLVVHGPAGDLARVGSYETGFVENDANHAFWNLPNVIALVPR